jgi:glycosyl hydrolase family 36
MGNRRLANTGMQATAFLLAAVTSATTLLAQSDLSDRQTKDPELARKILQDERMDEVVRMGHELLKTGMNAGSGYREVWIRDLNTFIVPLLDVTPREPVREALLTFFHFQGEDGNIVDGYVPADKAHVNYKYRSSPTRPDLKAHKNTVETDQESSLVQAVCRYIRKTGDTAILDQVVREIPIRKRLEMALAYPLNHRFSKEHGLAWGATTADWGDVQPEHSWGVELDASSHRAIDIYDNALLLVAIAEYLETACTEATLKTEWQNRQSRLRQSVREHLWDEVAQKYLPHIYLEGSPFPPEFDETKVYYHGGTAVAIEADLLTPHEILIAYGQMRANMRLAGAATLGLTLYPPYPAGTFKNKSMGLYSYQNGGDWTWFGARMVRQLARSGYVEESYRELTPMLDRVLKHRGFHEWWTPGNQPMGSGKFRGSAGVLIEAISELRTWAKEQ